VDDAQQRCTATRADGSPCQGKALPGQSLCVFHSSLTAGACAEGRKKGGRRCRTPAATLPANSADLPLATVPDVAAMLGDCINKVRRGELDSKVGNCVAVLAGVLLRALEGGELAAEVARLRDLVEGTDNDRVGAA
jgi:hypothetical protein